MNPAPTKFITTTAAARLAGVSNSTLLRACEARKLKLFRTPGGHYRVDPDSVLELFKPADAEAGEDLAARVKVLEGAVRWALGRLARVERRELRRRAALT